MPTVVQFRRGTTTQNENFTGAAGEISIDTQAGTLRVHNGIDEGGSNIASVSYVNTAISALSANSITSGTSNFSIIASNGNIRGTVGSATVTNIYSGGVELTGLLSATGNVTGGNINAVGVVTGTSFVGVATSAKYADLAENYLADAEYESGTVVEFGGSNEVTVSTVDHSTAVAGIVSTAPAHLMNSTLQGAYVVAVALTGRVPCLVQGPVNKGSVLVSGKIPGTAMAIDNLNFKPGCVVGKAMEAIESVDVKIIEVAVGRL